MELRPYQEDALRAVAEAEARGVTRQLVVMATGLGKTVAMGALIARRGSPRTLCLMHRDVLLEQAREKILSFCPALSVGMEKAERRSDPGRDGLILGSVQTLGRKDRGRLREIPAGWPSLVWTDEAHHAAADSYLQVLDHFGLHGDSPRRDRLLVGTSVGGDSRCLIEGPQGTKFVKIEDFFKEVQGVAGSLTYVDGYRVRAFDGRTFVWKKLKAVFAHEAKEKKKYRLRLETGRSVLVTEDHSVYVVDKVSGNRFSGLREKSGRDLREGDFVVLEGRLSRASPVDSFQMSEFSSDGDAFISGEFGEWIDRNVSDRALRFTRKRGKYGPCIPVREYLSSSEIKGAGSRIYRCGGKGDTWVSEKMPVSAIAYLIGFYLGDGWCSRDRVCFAVERPRIPDFLKRLANLSEFANIRHSIRDMHGASVEIRISNRTINDFFKKLTNGAKAKDKFIPGPVFGFDDFCVREFVRGMLDSDGHLFIHPEKPNKRKWTYTTISEELAFGLAELLKRLGIICSVYKRKHKSGGVIDGRPIIPRHETYDVFFSDRSWRGKSPWKGEVRARSVERTENAVPVRIVEKKPADSSLVYDLSVEDDHWQTFVASGVLVHNTATPDRFDEKGFDRIFDDVVYRYGLKEAIRDGWLADVRAWRMEADLDLSGVRTRGGDFVEKDLSEAVKRSRVNETAADAWAERCRGRRSLFFCVDKAHARDVEAALKRRGGRTALVVDETPTDERRAILSLFRAGEIEAVVNVSVLTEGFDEPATECIHILRPTKSAPLYIQILGRGTRRTPTKSHVDVYDYTAHCHDVCSAGAVFGLPDSWEMNGQSAPGDAAKLEAVEADLGLKVDGARGVQDLLSRVSERRLELIKGAIMDSGLPSKLAWIRPSAARERWVISWRNETEQKAERVGEAAAEILRKMRLWGVHERIEIFRNELGAFEAHLKRSGPAGSNVREGRMDSDRSLAKLVSRLEREIRDRRPHKVALLRKDARWTSEPSSDSQRQILKRKGVPEWLFPQLTKREASVLIELPGETVRTWFDGVAPPGVP